MMISQRCSETEFNRIRSQSLASKITWRILNVAILADDIGIALATFSISKYNKWVNTYNWLEERRRYCQANVIIFLKIVTCIKYFLVLFHVWL